MKEILSETYGVMVYQEQVMQIASAWPAILSARAMCSAARWGKKIKRRWRGSGKNFTKAALKKGIDDDTAMHDFR